MTELTLQLLVAHGWLKWQILIVESKILVDIYDLPFQNFIESKELQTPWHDLQTGNCQLTPRPQPLGRKATGKFFLPTVFICVCICVCVCNSICFMTKNHLNFAPHMIGKLDKVYLECQLYPGYSAKADSLEKSSTPRGLHTPSLKITVLRFTYCWSLAWRILSIVC